MFKILLVLGPASALADDCNERLADISDAFRVAYTDREVYRAGFCGRNVKNLINFLSIDRMIELRNPKVLLFLHEAREMLQFSFVYPAVSRNHDSQWGYHAVLQIDDTMTGEPMILDLDVIGVKVTNLREYLGRMFPEEKRESRYARMWMRVIPADEYVQAFSRAKTENKHLSSMRCDDQVMKELRDRNRTDYPMMTVNDYLSTIE